MRKVLFEQAAFEQYNDWAATNIKIFKKISKMIVETSRSPFEGIGQPEPLKNKLHGFWSRRIDSEHRLIYMVTDTEILITSCKFHY